MKNRFLLIGILLLILGTNSHAQKVRGVAIGGVNISQMNGDESVGYHRWGFNGGIGGMVPLNKNGSWLIGVETLITQKGAHENSDLMKYDAYLTYAEIPVLIHFEDKKGGFTFGTGLSYGRLIRSPKEEMAFTPNFRRITNTDFDKNDLCILADVRFKIWKQLKFNFRFAYSIIPIKTDIQYEEVVSTKVETWERNFYNNTLSFRLLWVFNEKEPQTKKIQR